MIRHVVAFRLRAGAPEQRQRDIAGLKASLEPLGTAIPGVLSLEVGEDLGLIGTHWDAVLVADYVSNEALEAYQADPRHVEALTWVNTVVTERAVVDYTVEDHDRPAS
jgi:hypothetical protein